MDTEPILIPIIPTSYSSKLTCLKNLTELDDEIEQYIEEEIFRPDRKIPLRTAKCVLVGPSSCGKTSLIAKLGHNGHIMFNERSPSMRIDYWIQDFEVFRVPFKLQIWDTIGSETVSKSFYRDAQAIMILFDLTKMDTLEEIKRYAEDILRSDPEEQLVFLIGCKKDLLSEAQCRAAEKQLEPILNELYAEYWPVSSLTGKNVQPLFSRVAALSFLRIIHTEIEVMESFRREAITLNSSDQPQLVKKKRRSCLRCLLI